MGHLASLPATPPVPTTSRVLREALVSPSTLLWAMGLNFMSSHPSCVTAGESSKLADLPPESRTGNFSQFPGLSTLGCQAPPWVFILFLGRGENPESCLPPLSWGASYIPEARRQQNKARSTLSQAQSLAPHLSPSYIFLNIHYLLGNMLEECD